MSAVDTSPFGRGLRHWRRIRGVSQLELATTAETTTRHVSFLETGRSRPSREMVDRLGDALTIPLRERNRLRDALGPTGRRSEPSTSRVICPHFRLGDTTIRTITIAARFESVTDITLDEIRVELTYPEDDTSERFFRDQLAHR